MDPDNRTTLLHAHLPRIQRLARLTHRRSYTFSLGVEDFVQAGVCGFL